MHSFANYHRVVFFHNWKHNDWNHRNKEHTSRKKTGNKNNVEENIFNNEDKNPLLINQVCKLISKLLSINSSNSFFLLIGFVNLGILLTIFILPIVFLGLFGITISSKKHENLILGIYFTAMYIPSIIFPTKFFLRHPSALRDTFHAIFH